MRNMSIFMARICRTVIGRDSVKERGGKVCFKQFIRCDTSMYIDNLILEVHTTESYVLAARSMNAMTITFPSCLTMVS